MPSMPNRCYLCETCKIVNIKSDDIFIKDVIL